MTAVPFFEAARRLGVSVRHVRRLVKKGELPAVPIGKHPNGCIEYGIREDALEAGGVFAAPTALPVGRRAPVRDRVPLTRDGAPDVAAMRAMGLGAHADEWDRRMRIVAEFMQARARHGAGRHVAAAVAAKYGICVSSLYNWQRALARGGPAALVPAWEPGHGRTCLPAGLQLQIREFYLNSRQATAEQVYRAVVVPFFVERGEDPPHVATVRRYIKTHILPIEETFWRNGRKAFRAACEPKVVRALPENANDWWCADHRLWDVLVVVPDGKGAGWGKHDKLACPCGSGRERRECCSVRRPWVTLVTDIASAAIVGWRIGLTPTAAGVCHALRSAILQFGVPAHFYRDNGKEFTATRLGGRAERLLLPRREDLEGHESWPAALPDEVDGSGVWAALGVEVVTALPYSAWSKPVESLFYAFARRWENLVPGWCGRDAQNKPAQLDIQIRNGALLSWSQFGEVFRGQVEEWNESHVCGDRAGPPLMYYTDARARARVRACARETLNYLLQDVRQVRVTTRGIELQEGGRVLRYYSPDIALYVGCVVTVRWDPEDSEWICVTTPDARLLALPRAEEARWGEFGAANTDAKAGARLQKEFIRSRMAEVQGSTPAERLDPTGAVAMIAGAAAEARERAAAEERLAAEAAAQLAAIEAAKAAAAAAPKPRTVYREELRGIA
jgi:transposase InsO family protein